MTELKEFQKAAVTKAVDRLCDRRGSQRFLVADEVGLGKTMVARGVIEAMRRRHSGGFTVVYVCSNLEIADQNQTKLRPEDSKDAPVSRLTLLAMRSSEVVRARREDKTQLFCFTPGTSFSEGTGIKIERRLLLYLLARVWGRRVKKPAWRRFFSCSADENIWLQETRFSSLIEQFHHQISTNLQNQLRQHWGQQKIKLSDPRTGKPLETEMRLSTALNEAVASYDSSNSISKKNRNRIVAALRQGLSSVALSCLEPDLIVLDEFQKFGHILSQSRKPNSIVGRLFNGASADKTTLATSTSVRGRRSVLILSATPYRMYTLRHEGEDHHKDLFHTLGFLRSEDDKDSLALQLLKEDLAQFRERLVSGEWLADGGDPQLEALKQKIEGELKKLMCRTERNWFIEESEKGIQEVPASGDCGTSPQVGELVDYVRLRRFLLDQQIADWNVTDFWKSCPSIVSFMDSHYALIRTLRRTKPAIPPTVFRKSSKLQDRWRDNVKFRMLFDKLFPAGTAAVKAKDHFQYLWIAPTLSYYKTDFFPPNHSPHKYLVFSHWRFVPKSIAALMSGEVEQRLGKSWLRKKAVPLQFRKRLSFYPFDVCYPSLVLAKTVDLLTLAGADAGAISPQELIRRAEKCLLKLLKDSKIEVSERRSAPVWQIVARLEGTWQITGDIDIRKTLRETRVRSRQKKRSEYYSDYAKQYVRWMDDDQTPLTISKKSLRRLAIISLFSPAISVLRAVRTVFPDVKDVWLRVVSLCLNELRTYFNKPLVRGVIRRYVNRRVTQYPLQVLYYCRDGQFQAVLDEYVYLLKNVLQRHATDKFFPHLGRALGMWSGLPKLNERSRTGRIGKKPAICHAHFALAFGDDVATDPTDTEGKSRKSEVREAFNSPFWPFVLATTSVGQEGLDFHLYCRDIVHWNLPSNPVDLEQREGRINRFDGVAIRQFVARDYGAMILRERKNPGDNVWNIAFRRASGANGNSAPLCGLHPHWLYSVDSTVEFAHPKAAPLIRRHLMMYRGSRDCLDYHDLKVSLSLYRLAFGQPRQYDLVEMLKRKTSEGGATIEAALRRCAINLSPVDTQQPVLH